MEDLYHLGSTVLASQGTFPGLPGGSCLSLLSTFFLTVPASLAVRGGVITCGLQSQLCPLLALGPRCIFDCRLPHISKGKNHNIGCTCLPGILWNHRAPKKAEGLLPMEALLRTPSPRRPAWMLPPRLRECTPLFFKRVLLCWRYLLHAWKSEEVISCCLIDINWLTDWLKDLVFSLFPFLSQRLWTLWKTNLFFCPPSLPFILSNIKYLSNNYAPSPVLGLGDTRLSPALWSLHSGW